MRESDPREVFWAPLHIGIIRKAWEFGVAGGCKRQLLQAMLQIGSDWATVCVMDKHTDANFSRSAHTITSGTLCSCVAATTDTRRAGTTNSFVHKHRK